MQYFYLIIYQLILLNISSTNIHEETERRFDINRFNFLVKRFDIIREKHKIIFRRKIKS